MIAVTTLGASPVSTEEIATITFAATITGPRPKRATNREATIEPMRAPTPMPAVTKPIAAGATWCTSRKNRIVAACAKDRQQPTTEVKTTIDRR